MLDQLRAMGIFACVVRQNSFSGAAKELGITTSAVSQQIRSLEQDMEVTLLYRSTRKISLTEAGQVFFLSCKEMLAAAERGKKSINELHDDLIGNLRISAHTDLIASHIIPALSQWMHVHQDLKIQFESAKVDQTNTVTPDITLNIRLQHEVPRENEVALADVEQLLVAAPNYLHHHSAIIHPTDLQSHILHCDRHLLATKPLFFTHVISTEKAYVEIPKKQLQQHVSVVKAFALNALGVAQVLSLDVQKELFNGQLSVVLADWKLPKYRLYASVVDHYSPRSQRCLEVLKSYFDRISGIKLLKEAS